MSTEINALTLRVADMAASVDFYGRVLGLTVAFGGEALSPFTTFEYGGNFINLTREPGNDVPAGGWGRAVLHHPDPDLLWHQITSAGWETETEPADAPWGERYFHVRDPDGHELSFARRL